jgi:hypothetical protein
MHRKTQVRRSSLILSLSLLLVAGCTMHGHLYNLASGEVTDVRFTYNGSGHGTISGQFNSGEKFHGDYTTFVHPPIGFGLIYGSVYGQFAWGQAAGASSQQYGTAIASGDKGFVADCEYITQGLSHGAGACKAKDGSRYKIIW